VTRRKGDDLSRSLSNQSFGGEKNGHMPEEDFICNHPFFHKNRNALCTPQHLEQRCRQNIKKTNGFKSTKLE